MRLLLAYVLWLVFSTISLSAATVSVRSAEHDGFTRIAIDLSRANDVKVAMVEGGLKVTLPKNTSSIDLSSAFRRISKDRVDGMIESIERKEIDVSLRCNCPIETFLAGSATFVIDIYEAKGPSQTEQENGLPIQKAKANDIAILNESDVEPKPSKPLLLAKSPIDRQLSEAVAAVRSNVARNEVTKVLTNSLQLEARGTQTGTGEVVPKQSEDSNKQITFRSLGVVQGSNLSDFEKSATTLIRSCERMGELSPANWPQYENAGAFLALTRRSFAKDVEKSPQAATRKLALSYLSLGMGAEASAILETLGESDQFNQNIIALAHFIEEPNLPIDTKLLEYFRGCEEVLIWSLIDSSKTTVQGLFDEKQVQLIRAQFDRWPSALKGLFAPLLADRLLERKEKDIAKFAMRRSEDLPTARSGERLIAQAKIAKKMSTPSDVISILRPVVDDDLDTAPEAAISLATLAAEQGEDLRARDKFALEAYQNELKGTPLESELLRARIITAMQEEDFEGAVALAEDFAKLVRPSKLNVVLDELGLAILGVSGDSTFLKEAVSLPAEFFNQIAKDTQQQIKNRVVSLGFADLAGQLGQYTARSRDRTTQKKRAVDQAEGIAALAAAIEPALNSKKPPIQESEQLETPVGDAETINAARNTDENASSAVNFSPLASAIGETRAALDSFDELEQEFTRLGLE